MTGYRRRRSEEWEYERERAQFHIALGISPAWDAESKEWVFLYDDLTPDQLGAWRAAWKELNKGG